MKNNDCFLNDFGSKPHKVVTVDLTRNENLKKVLDEICVGYKTNYRQQYLTASNYRFFMASSNKKY